MEKIRVGDIYLHFRKFREEEKEKHNRYYKILSVTLTHVYIQNVRTGRCFNQGLGFFNANYHLVSR